MKSDMYVRNPLDEKVAACLSVLFAVAAVIIPLTWALRWLLP